SPGDGPSGRGATWRDGQQVPRRWLSGPLRRRWKLEGSCRRGRRRPLEMLHALPRLNRELALPGDTALTIGIGIHTGPAIVGSIGSPNRLEDTENGRQRAVGA